MSVLQKRKKDKRLFAECFNGNWFWCRPWHASKALNEKEKASFIFSSRLIWMVTSNSYIYLIFYNCGYLGGFFWITHHSKSFHKYNTSDMAFKWLQLWNRKRKWLVDQGRDRLKNNWGWNNFADNLHRGSIKCQRKKTKFVRLI